MVGVLAVRKSSFNQWIIKNARQINFFNEVIVKRFCKKCFFLAGGSGFSVLESIISKH